MAESLLAPGAMEWVGREVDRTSGVVSRKEFQRFATAVGDLNPLYFDDEAARAQGHAGVIAPPMFLPHVLLGVARLDQLREDGIPVGAEGNLPIRAERRMAGGEEYELFASLYPGDTITAVTKIGSIDEKTGRSGPFVLVTRETTYTNQHGVVVAKGRFTIIAR